MESITSYQIRVSSRHPHVAARILSLLTTSRHNENTLAENEYDLYECSDEVVFLDISKHDELQTQIEYEADSEPDAHAEFISALTGFPDTSVRVLEQKLLG